MHVYFVRHGESEGNVTMVHQGPDVLLSPSGIAQSRALANRFKDIPVDRILSSDLNRAKVTAQIIAEAIEKDVSYVPVFRELISPKELEGLALSDDESVRIHDLRIKNQDDPNWRYSDEENFFDATKRAEQALQMLEELSSERVIVITHSLFVFHLIARILFPKGISPKDFRQFKKHADISNAGVTLCEFSREEQTWKLLSWNNETRLE